MNNKSSTTSAWRRFALPVSVILNLFFVTLIGGHELRTKMDEHAAGSAPLMRALANADSSLSASDAAAFNAVMRRDAPRYAAAAQQLDEAREQLETRITADPYNPIAVRQALAAWQVSWNRFIGDVGDPLVDALAQVSPEGRRKLVAVRRARVGPTPP
jgi:hypothetical protein